MTRTILHTGAGGPGTAAVAAATALRCAAGGRRTLLVSTGPVHGLGDVLGRTLGAGPAPVGELLWALEVGAAEELAERWGAARSAGAHAPGAAELAAGLVLAEQASAGGWDVVVVDAGPLAEALRLLALPGLARDWLAGLPRERGRRPAAAGGPLGALLPGAGADDGRAARTLATLDDVLEDRERCSARLIVDATAATPATARRAAALLELHGLAVDAVVALSDASMPAALQDAFAPVPVFGAAAPRTPAALGALGLALWAGADPASILHAAPGPELVVGGTGATLRLPLPHAEHAELSLQREDGALVVRLAGYRRTLTLPPAVADYRPAGARFADGALQVELQAPAP